MKNDACLDGASVVADEKGATSWCPVVCCRQSIKGFISVSITDFIRILYIKFI